MEPLQIISIVLALVSAGAWFRSAFVKVTPQAAIAKRNAPLIKAGLPPQYGSASLDGWDMSATFAAQSKWNAIGASCAGLSIVAQAFA